MERNQSRAQGAWVFVLVFVLAFGFISCGEEPSNGPSKREFGQGVDLITYQIQSASVTVESLHRDPVSKQTSEERISRQLNLNGSSPKDQITRVIKGPDFKLMVNGEESAVEISSQENMDHHQVASENSGPECRLVGRSDVSGKASSLDLNFNWNLEVAVEGRACEDMRAKMKVFIESELQRFHMNSVNDLLTAADLNADHRERIRLRVEIRGTSE